MYSKPMLALLAIAIMALVNIIDHAQVTTDQKTEDVYNIDDESDDDDSK